MSHSQRFLLAPALVACLLAGGAGSVLADDDLGAAEGLVVPGVGEMNVEGYTVFRDDQGSLYLKKGDHVIKPQAGDTVKHGGGSEVQAEENNEQVNAGLRDFGIQFAGTAPPPLQPTIDVEIVALSLISAQPVDIAIPVLGDLLDEVLELDPPLFGDTPYAGLGFFDIFVELDTLFVIGSATGDGLTPALFELPVGSWVEFTPTATLRVIDVVDAPAPPGPFDGSHHIVYAANVAEPAMVLMLGLGLLVMAVAPRRSAA